MSHATSSTDPHAMPAAPAGHLLAHHRTVFQIPDAVDVSTTSAFDFDVDAGTGFMPALPPLATLPATFARWEEALAQARIQKIRPAAASDLSEDDARVSARWRATVSEMPVLPVQALVHSETLLRRAHHVLTFLLSFYAHSHPRPAADAPPAPLHIPASIGVPLSTVSRQIGIAPVVTYADTVLWNWAPVSGSLSSIAPSAPNLNILAPPSSPTPDEAPELRCLSLFTGTQSEAHFYVTSARIELGGARALTAMERTLDELFLGDSLAVRRIVGHLNTLAGAIDGMTALLATMRSGCDPTEFYRDVRPWFVGGEAWPGGMGWEFDGVTDDAERERARFTNGASAGQSSIVHTLDVFLGTPNTLSPYLHKMEYHMPRHHRAFLRHLRALPQTSTLAHLLQSSLATDELKRAFNDAVLALKRFRDTHIRVAALYIVTQAHSGRETKVQLPQLAADGEPRREGVKGTGGTDLVPFLKNLRDNTARTVVPLSPPVNEETDTGRAERRRAGCPF